MRIPTSPGRSGFGPELSLTYDSGSGNGPFGLGWSLSTPAITRRTDKGLPQYRDAEESDVFILSGAEDLVPVLGKDGARHEDRTMAPGYTIHRYRPRIEGLFARIERWTEQATGEMHWRSITRDNVTTLYGQDNDSRIFDPADPAPSHPTRVFSWLICHSFDDKGNATSYEYAREDAAQIDLSQASEERRVRAAGRYLRRIQYGNRTSRLVEPDLSKLAWLFEVVFDYDQGHCQELPLDPARNADEQHQYVRASAAPGHPWAVRPDPFSSYRSGFEVRTYRRCRRVLMFHRFPELGEEPCLVRSLEIDYADLDYSRPVAIEDELSHQGSTRLASFIRSITQCGFVRDPARPVEDVGGVRYVTYLKKWLPPVELEYSRPVIADELREVDADSVENLPVGLDGAAYRWVDLDGEGISGVLTEQAGAWFYKPNLGQGRFGSAQLLPARPAASLASGGGQQLLDLSGDGQLDVVSFEAQPPGFHERTFDGSWAPFRAFRHLPQVPWGAPHVRLVDLDGDGLADVLVGEDDAFTFYPSLLEEGYGPGRAARLPQHEDRGARLVLADAEQSIYLADMTGDGLPDLLRIRNGEVCYWPNLGYGRFGAKVTMDDAPRFDRPDQFDQRRVRLADIDGSGTTDILYLGVDAVRIYFNQSGNRWSQARRLLAFPPADDLASVTAVDLLGNGTTCLVWSSPLPASARRPLRYIDLMGGKKPHLLIRTANNLGAETRVSYTSSTAFYLADKAAGKTWITRLPFPVHVVERIETYDRISRNRFVTRYSYHHGHFDGVEREFCGFGRVDQQDTEQLATLAGSDVFPVGDNVDATSHVPPVLTRTWFHTGVHLGRDLVSRFFSGSPDGTSLGEYYRPPGATPVEALELLLPDTLLPESLTVEEEREACRALRGSMLRQEVYSLDGTDRERHPYLVLEQSFLVEALQRRASNRHAVLFAHPRESLSYHYERALLPILGGKVVDDATAASNPAVEWLPDPRVTHAITLAVDEFGNVLGSAAIAYGRRFPDLRLPAQRDRDEQARIRITCSAHDFTNPINDTGDHRAPLPCESRVYELTGLELPAGRARFTFQEVVDAVAGAAELSYEESPNAGWQKRLIDDVRTVYRSDDLTAALPLGEVQARALPYQTYQLVFTAGLVTQLYGAKVSEAMLEDQARHLHSEGDDRWWAPSGRFFYSPDPAASAAAELARATKHFFLPVRFRDPFHAPPVSTESFVTYDVHDLLVAETRDALGNRITVGERDLDPTKPLMQSGQDYRVLQPALVMDPNRNRTALAFDALGRVAGTAVMGKPEELPARGDALGAAFRADLTASEIDQFFAAPEGALATALLGGATSRAITDVLAYVRQPDPERKPPAFAAALTRESHVSDGAPPGGLRIQRAFSYSDGFGREIQGKVQAEAGPVPKRDASGKILVGADGQPIMTVDDVAPRWVGTGWTVLDNKGNPVRKYEPFFTDTHRFELDVRIGVSPILLYDPVGRVAATLFPDHTWEKLVRDPWRQQAWDASDNVLVADPRTDRDVGALVSRLPTASYLPSWYDRRKGGGLGLEEQAAASKAAIHAATPAASHSDSLGRVFLTVEHNRFKYSDAPPLAPPVEERYETRTTLDIEGNRRAVTDAQGRLVLRCGYNMAGTRVWQSSMEAGQRWTLSDVSGQPLYAWDELGRRFRTAHDPLRRPTDTFLDSGGPGELRVERRVYGESLPSPELKNQRTQVVQTFDQAGTVTTDEYDFKANPLVNRRRLAVSYDAVLDWDSSVPLHGESYTSATRFDALNRPVEQTSPDGSVTRIAYNQAGLLEQLNVNLRGAMHGGSPVWTPFVTDIDYDARAQRTRIEYGNGVHTTYDHDPLTFRLTRLVTRRDPVAFPGDCPKPPLPGWPGCQVQDLRYTYDPAGNITQIRDTAQQAVYFRNAYVEPSATYTYDAVRRLIEATGREHLGHVGGAPVPHSYNDVPRTNLAHLGDGNALGRYLEQYTYDPAGNLGSMKHRSTGPVSSGWTRTYAYDEPSLLEAGKRSNRLTSTKLGAVTETYSTAGDGYDAHGSMRRMPHLRILQWDFKDQLQMTQRQAVNPADSEGVARHGERTYYVYDSGGQRVRKVTERPDGSLKDERIYLGALELYRRHGGSPLVRETLHVLDGQQRVALVETRTAGTEAGVPAQLIRYQLGNHLGSAVLELDDRARIISYEETTPYGSTSYQGARVRKRYRFTGKERDEENGFSYHGARYHAPWLARWTSADPIGIEDGLNVYAFCRGDPVALVDDSGMDARLSVEQGQSAATVTYATKIHIFGNKDELARFTKSPGPKEEPKEGPLEPEKGSAAARVTNFFRDASGQVNIDGRSVTVKYDVSFAFHDVATEPLPAGITAVRGVAKSRAGGVDALSLAATAANFASATRKIKGFEPGDGVAFFEPGLKQPGANTPLPASTLGTSSIPASNALSVLKPELGAEGLFRALAHEVSHTLGFGDRYRELTSTQHEGYEQDVMSALDLGVPEIGFDRRHLEASARFALFIVNGRNLRGGSVALGGFRVDTTTQATSGDTPEIVRGVRNSEYDSLQRGLRTDGWKQIRDQLAPPPRLQLIPGNAPRSQPGTFGGLRFNF